MPQESRNSSISSQLRRRQRSKRLKIGLLLAGALALAAVFLVPAMIAGKTGKTKPAEKAPRAQVAKALALPNIVASLTKGLKPEAQKTTAVKPKLKPKKHVDKRMHPVKAHKAKARKHSRSVKHSKPVAAPIVQTAPVTQHYVPPAVSTASKPATKPVTVPAKLKPDPAPSRTATQPKPDAAPAPAQTTAHRPVRKKVKKPVQAALPPLPPDQPPPTTTTTP